MVLCSFRDSFISTCHILQRRGRRTVLHFCSPRMTWRHLTLDSSASRREPFSVAGMKSAGHGCTRKSSVPAWTISSHSHTQGHIYHWSRLITPHCREPKVTPHSPPLPHPHFYFLGSCPERYTTHHLTLFFRLSQSQSWPHCLPRSSFLILNSSIEVASPLETAPSPVCIHPLYSQHTGLSRTLDPIDCGGIAGRGIE